MIGTGIADDDKIIIDTSMVPYAGKIVMASIDSEYTVKRFTIDKRGQGWLMPENPDYPPLRIEGSEFSIFAVVARCLHHLAKSALGYKFVQVYPLPFLAVHSSHAHHVSRVKCTATPPLTHGELRLVPPALRTTRKNR